MKGCVNPNLSLSLSHTHMQHGRLVQGRSNYPPTLSVCHERNIDLCSRMICALWAVSKQRTVRFLGPTGSGGIFTEDTIVYADVLVGIGLARCLRVLLEHLFCPKGEANRFLHLIWDVLRVVRARWQSYVAGTIVHTRPAQRATCLLFLFSI